MIVYAADEHYVPHAAASIHSLLSSWDATDEPRITLLDCGLTTDDVRRLHVSFGAAVDVIRFDYERLDRLPKLMHFGSAASYARLLVDELIAPEHDRLIYLDCDTIMVDSIHHYRSIHLEDRPIGAVSEVNAPLVGNPRALRGYERVGLPPEERYFNSGVLVIDRPRWRAEAIGDRCVDFVEKHAEWLRYPDQDALNAVAAGRIHALDPSWNCGGAWNNPGHPAYEWYGNVPARARVVHFVGHLKPWRPDYDNSELAARYFEHRAHTAYA